jgi:2,3-dihydroxybiphenyl 1,2-dioxygenase
MIGRMKLGYLVLEVRRPAAWHEFSVDMLGLPPASANADGSAGYRTDGAAQRLVLREGPADDVAAIGLELADEAALAELRRRLERSGTEVMQGDGPLCRARRATRLLAFHDPEGTRLEAALGIEQAPSAFASAYFPGGFGSEATGFGHAVLVARDLAAMERFYVCTLGFAVTERLAARVGPLEVRGTFLHCNRRHHTLALMVLPETRKLHHFMLEARSVVDVLRAQERARAHRVPFSLGLGQHPDPDGTVSFYGRTPSGIDFEIGACGREIEPHGWREATSHTTSSWGHKPTLGLQLRAARGMLLSRFGRGPKAAARLAGREPSAPR